MCAQGVIWPTKYLIRHFRAKDRNAEIRRKSIWSISLRKNFSESKFSSEALCDHFTIAFVEIAVVAAAAAAALAVGSFFLCQQYFFCSLSVSCFFFSSFASPRYYCAASARWIERQRRICQPNISKLYRWFFFLPFALFDWCTCALAYSHSVCVCVRFDRGMPVYGCVCSLEKRILHYDCVYVINYNNDNNNNKNNIIWFVFHSLAVHSFSRTLNRYSYWNVLTIWR